MYWNRRYLIKSYIRNSLWLVPFFAMMLYWILSRITHGLGGWLLLTGRIDQSSFFGLSMAGTRSALETIVTLNLSFLVFTFSSLLVAIQVAGGQYTPRIIATTILRDNNLRFTTGYFVFTLLFAGRLLSTMGGETVPQFDAFIAGVLGLGSVVIFLYLIDYAARFLRPVSLVQLVGKSGIAVIQNVYQDPPTRPRPLQPNRRPTSPDRTVANTGTSGIVLAVHLAGLIAQARQANGIIEFVPQIGDFVEADEPLFRLYGGAGAIHDTQLQAAVAFGSERTMERDTTFAFRILVDVAIKALSPAINDPTTAVLAIDQLHRLLRHIGLRQLPGEDIRDEAGELRLIFRTPNWEDFVHLTCTEIRQCGAGSVQIMRRMRSMLENLLENLPTKRHALLLRQLELLDRTIVDQYPFAEDRAIARIPDSQGLGGAQSVQAATGLPTAEVGAKGTDI